MPSSKSSIASTGSALRSHAFCDGNETNAEKRMNAYRTPAVESARANYYEAIGSTHRRAGREATCERRVVYLGKALLHLATSRLSVRCFSILFTYRAFLQR